MRSIRDLGDNFTLSSRIAYFFKKEYPGDAQTPFYSPWLNARTAALAALGHKHNVRLIQARGSNPYSENVKISFKGNQNLKEIVFDLSVLSNGNSTLRNLMIRIRKQHIILEKQNERDVTRISHRS